MDRKEAAQWAEIYQAYADGKKIQGVNLNGEWADLSEPLYFSAPLAKYRIKPEPKVIWVNEFNGDPVAFSSEDEARNFKTVSYDRTAVKYIEALD